MDHAVALVQAYLQVNGYLTAAEVPVLTPLPEGGYQSATDIDLLALRLCDAGGVALPPGSPAFAPDPALAVPKGAADFLVVEVKEGRAELNRGARDPDVLRTIFGQFGLARHDRPERAFRQLERDGKTRWPGDVWVRRLAFGSTVDPTIVRGFRAISLTHVTSFLTDFIRRNWPSLRYAQLRQPALGFFALLEQVERARVPGTEEERDER